MAASSSSNTEDQQFLNNLGSACREIIFKNEKLLSKCYLDIEAGPTVDYQIALRNTTDALLPVEAKPTSGLFMAPMSGSASGSGLAGLAAEGGPPRTDQAAGDSETPVVAVTATLTSVFEYVSTDLCRLADDHLFDCVLPPWVNAVSRQLARAIINLAASEHFEIRWTVAIPTQAQLKRETVSAVTEYRRTVRPPPANVNILPGVLTASSGGQSTIVNSHSASSTAQHSPSANQTSTAVDATATGNQPVFSPECTTFGGYQSYTCPPGIRPLQVKAITTTLPIDQALKQARVFVGQPVLNRLQFQSDSNGAYAKWRVAFADALERISCSRQVATEAVLQCLPQSVIGAIERSVHPSDIEKFGHTAIIYALDNTYLTKLELRTVSQSWDRICQLPNEAVRQYASRFEDCAHVYTTLYSTHGLSDRDITAKFAEGLRGPREVLGRCLIDPECKLGYEAYKLALYAFLDNGATLPDAFSDLISGQPRQQGPGKAGSRKIDHSQIISICALATKELGIPPENCLRCGLPSHQASSCRNSHIFKQNQRCGRCGRLREGDNHRCAHKSFKCGRCKRTGHLSGVCRKVITGDSNPSTANVSSTDPDAPEALKIIHNNIACASSQAALYEAIGSLPADPVVHLQVGHTAPKTYCPIKGLVDSGANASLLSTATVNFLLANDLLKPSDVKALPQPVSVTFGNDQALPADSVAKVPCYLGSTGTVAISFLVVDGCRPHCLVGRNMFPLLGIRLVSDKGVSIDCNTATTNVTSSTTTTTTPQTLCARSEAALTPLVEVFPDDIDSGRRRLRARLPAVEDAAIHPYRAPARKRSIVDQSIIHHRLLRMAEEGKVKQSAPENCVCIFQPVLVDKLDSGDGTGPKSVYPSEDLHRRYRITTDIRPLNHLSLRTDSQGRFVYYPQSAVRDLEPTSDVSHKQYQGSAIEQLRRTDIKNCNFWCRIDLVDAFGCVRIHPSLMAKIATTSVDPINGKEFVWQLCTIPQGWCWSSILFHTCVHWIVHNPIKQALSDAKCRCSILFVQDDILLGCPTKADAVDALSIVTTVLNAHCFTTNPLKTTGPTSVTPFCGLIIESGGRYRPHPSKRVFTDASYGLAWKEFVDGTFKPKRKRGAKKAILPLNSKVSSRLSWLKSWSGTFNYFLGHLGKQELDALHALGDVSKQLQEPNIADDEIEAQTPVVQAAFKVLFDYYLSGIPAMLAARDDAAIGTIILSDANCHGWSAVILRVTLDNSYSNIDTDTEETTFRCQIPDLQQFFPGTTGPLKALPLRLLGGKWPPRTASSRSSTWKERAAILLAVDECIGLLEGRVVVIVDNQNVQKEWRSFANDFTGPFLHRWQQFLQVVHDVRWSPRDTSPVWPDALARAISDNGEEREDSDIIDHSDTVVRCQAATADDDAPDDAPEDVVSDVSNVPDGLDPDAALRHVIPVQLLRRSFDAWRGRTTFQEIATIPVNPVAARAWLKDAQANDSTCRRLAQLPHSQFTTDGNGILRYGHRYVMPQKFACSIIEDVHIFLGHSPIKQTHDNIVKAFYIPGVSRQVQHVVSRCVCQFSAGRRGNISPIGPPLRNSARSMKILDCCFLDVVGPLPISTNFSHPFKYIISCMDCCSGYCWFWPTPDISSRTISGILETRLVDQVGVPRVFVVDNARYFSGVFFKGWVASIGATLRFIPVASPHRNALLERQHSGLKKSLKALCAKNPETWPSYVTKAQRRVNTRTTYGYSPQELFYGFDSMTPFNRRFEDVNDSIDEDSVRSEARRRVRERQKMIDSTLNMMEKLRADAISRVDPATYSRQVSRRRTFNVGDSVMKWVRNADPMTPSWKGPLQVQQALGDSTYILSDGTVQDSRNMRRYYSSN